MIANILGLKVDIIESEEGPGYGAAILAAVGCGIFPDVQTAAKNLVHVIDTTDPEKELVQKYEKCYQKFCQIYPTVKTLYQKLN